MTHSLIAFRRQISPYRRWSWIAPAAAAFLFAATSVAHVVLRARFITIAGRSGGDPVGKGIFSLSVMLPALFAAWGCRREARLAARFFREQGR